MIKIKTHLKAIADRVLSDLKNYYIAIIFIVAYNIIVRAVFRAFCPFLITIGLPCAGCGMTRAIFQLFTGSFARAMSLNPAAPLWVIFIIWFIYKRYIKGTTPKSAMLWLGIVSAATFLIYIYRMINYFPSDPPLVYYRNNLLAKLINVLSQ